ncbi:MAG: MBOAT family O-acyltransferase [Chlorobiaceae bacterium]
MTIVIIGTFIIGKLIDECEDNFKKRLFLWIGVCFNIGLLMYFKYVPFITQNLNLLLQSIGIKFSLDKPDAIVSIGLSFYIFQAISYLADIYFRMIKPEPHFGYLSLYLAFFPKLLQGPIERAADLIPQLKAKYKFDYDNMRFGMLLFTIGLFKKVVIADRLGMAVDLVYNNLHAFTGLPLLLATYAYAFQIFMDFSGYTDMALGSALLFNINLTQNFNNPFLATSVADFWRRWHISLSRWILDYLFEPLQILLRSMGKFGTALALMAAFILAGVWHGANWTFVAFGLIHGVYLASSFIYKPYQKKIYKALNIKKNIFLKAWQFFIIFNLMCLAWVFFRSPNIDDALYVVTHIFIGLENYISYSGVKKSIYGIGFLGSYLRGMIALGLLWLLPLILGHNIIDAMSKADSLWFRWFSYYILIISILVFGVFNNSQFIYFKF